MKQRRPGLQGTWGYIVNSLQEIIPSYELASSRISLYADKRMRAEAIGYAVGRGSLVLDLGAGPGTMSHLVEARGGEPVLVDVSRMMLRVSSFQNRVQAVFEHLPFREGVFDAVVSGFALRDSHDLKVALGQIAGVVRRGGRFAFADLGKPDSAFGFLLVGFYLRVVPNVIGLLTTGRSGLRYGSIFDTYMLTLRNSVLASALSRLFGSVEVHGTQFGGSVVVKCSK
ncbi:MAG TPA: methyltransferase domain-containing protein [Nitrososphaerales archaeon]|nr:methyltransferase domain-containing protein [Nitrososphaerales archaeon]